MAQPCPRKPLRSEVAVALTHVKIPEVIDGRFQHFLRGARWDPRDVGRPVLDGKYVLREAKHVQHEGVTIIATKFMQEEPLGLAYMDFFWVHPDHRRTRLGVELHVAFILAHGEPVVSEIDGTKVAHSQLYAKQKKRRLTPDGIRMMHSSYKLLVERGHVK